MTALAFIGQGIVIGLGWYVVHLLSAARDLDKARREMVAKSADGIALDAKAIFLKARAYHVAVRDISNEFQIKMDLQDIALRTAALSQVCRDGVALTSCRASIAALRRATTGEHFEDEHVAPLSIASLQLQLIAAESSRVQQAFLILKHLQFGTR